ncbi:hypothetical protein SZ64_04585 [Erythrobacter sp. SG61-1L]|uniref:DUF5131 family protein n=1 Tax=Erythrobacter sp. SG61-1L TaxID=1603897 RepID=UPI0006C91A5F|nr:phage Gp37/Gp68 family protein [Erythrobacter sp. SG61-1L]KPL67443.1 hypothetical protein SZ64_04585 [Erythrobacter sp. SG61-1L]
MADGTAIEWTDATWNPVTGCSVTSPGCTNCYAMKLAGTRLRNVASRAGLTRPSKAGPVWTGEVRFNEAELLKPLRWRRPRKIFVCAHGDLFHENVPDEWIDRVFAVMALCPQHTFQVLTKRSARMASYCDRITSATGAGAIADMMGSLGGSSGAQADFLMRQAENSCLPNVWLGVSVEDQARADERIPYLLDTPAAVRFLSMEPLLGAVDLANIEYHPGFFINCLTGEDVDGTWPCVHKVNWVIVGGESGRAARIMHTDWARSLRDQCAAAGVAFFLKQLGEYAPRRGPHGMEMQRVGKKSAGRLLDNVEHSEFPE